MFDDLVELATTAVHADHSPHISHPITNNASSANMPPRRRRDENSQSASSATADVNGMLPPASPASKSAALATTRHKRTRSSGSQAASPRQLAQALTTRPHQEATEAAPMKFIAAAITYLVLSYGLRELSKQYMSSGSGVLGAFSKVPTSEFHALSLLGWRIFVLAIYWFGGYDGTLDLYTFEVKLTSSSIRCSISDGPHYHAHRVTPGPFLQHQPRNRRKPGRI